MDHLKQWLDLIIRGVLILVKILFINIDVRSVINDGIGHECRD